MKTLRNYIKEKKMSVQSFAKLVNNYVDKHADNKSLSSISASHLYKISNDPYFNLGVGICKSIYLATEEKFGEGLPISEYLDIKHLI